MAVFDIFSKRQKRLRGELPDVYQYDHLPEDFRVQLVHLLTQVLGPYQYPNSTIMWYDKLHQILVKEYSLFRLHQHGQNNQENIVRFVLDMTTPVERVIDVIEVMFYVASKDRRGLVITPKIVLDSVSEAVNELNHRFQEHGIGYRYEPQVAKVVRVDSEFLHQEVVKPSLRLLQSSDFAGAEQEFHKAHTHYRDQEYEDTISESFKALESTLKVICARKGWSVSERDSASKLIQIIFDHRLIPPYLQSHFNGLRTILEGGVPTIRNQDSGHGTGTTSRRIPPYLAAFALHLTASAIVFLAEAAED